MPHNLSPLLSPCRLQVLSDSPVTPPQPLTHHQDDPIVLCCRTVPSSSMSCSHSMICPPRPQCPPPSPVWPGAAGGRRRRRGYSKQDRLKNETRQGAAAGAALPQAGAAPAQPREGRAGPGPARRSSRNESRHRHSARWAQAQGSHGVLHHGLKLERKHMAVSPCLQCSESPHHPPGTWDGGLGRPLLTGIHAQLLCPRHCTSISAPTKRVSSPKAAAASEKVLGVSNLALHEQKGYKHLWHPFLPVPKEAP